MGYETVCTVTVDGRRFRGTAYLESGRLTFRGETRIDIRFDQVHAVRADDGRVVVQFGDRQAAFELGEAAAKWAARIANPPARIAKLGVKAGMTVALLEVDDSSLAAEVEGTGAAITSDTGARGFDMIFVGVRAPDDLRRLEMLADRITASGAIWVIRAKGKSAAVTEAASMAAGKAAGLVDVKVVSFSDTHSAEKYVIPRVRRPAAPRSRSDRPASPLPPRSGSRPTRGRR